MTDARDPLDVVIARATRPDSIYWSFRDLEGADPSVERRVEVRLNLDPAVARDFSVAGRTVQQVDEDGAIYLRRSQPLTDDAVQSLIVEMITLAHDHNGRFWSWMHGDDLDA